MRAPPILRATDPGGGKPYDDPSEDLLLELMLDLEEIGTPGASFTVERLENGREDDFMRVALREGGAYGLEGPLTDGAVRAGSRDDVHQAITRWAFDLPRWDETLPAA